MTPGFVLNNTEAPVWLIFNTDLSQGDPAALDIQFEAQASTPGLTITTEAWNWTTSAYEAVDSSAASFNIDQVETVDITNSDYVEPGTNSVRSRIGWRQTGFVLSFPWIVFVDQFVWVE